MRLESKASSNWKNIPERGTVLGIRAGLWFSRALGRRGTSFLLWLLSWYYALTDGVARRASRDYLTRIGARSSLSATAQHLRYFARVTLDRFLFLCDQTEGFEVHLHGHERLVAALAPQDDGGGAGTRKGALLLGSHVGSFDAMRALARKYDVPISIVADIKNAARINSLFSELNPNSNTRMIALDPESAGTALDIKACIDAGELVAILGDRTAPGERRTVLVDFLGEKALLPTGPYLLAHMLRCPVFLVYSLFTPPNRYDLHCEELARSVVLPRGAREGAIAEIAQRYATRLEEVVKTSPLNWFNFYDFWKKP